VTIKKTVYEVDEIKIKLSNSSIIVDDNRISKITIMKDFLGKVYPTLIIDINLLLEDYISLLEEEDTVITTVKMYSRALDETDDSKVMHNKTYIEGNFYTTLNIETPAGNRKVAEKQEIAEDADFKQNEYRSVKLGLISTDILGKYRTLINGNFSGNLTSLIAYSLNTCGITDNVVMSKLDNIATYENVIVPGLNLLGTLKYLHEMYGLYEYPFYLFMDIERTYILNTGPTPKATVTNDINDIKINVLDDDDNTVRGYVSEEDVYTYNIGIKDIKYKRKRLMLEDLYNSITLSSTEVDQTSVTESILDNFTGLDYRKHLVGVEHNSLYASAVSKGVIVNNVNLDITFKAVDCSVFDPNCIYTVIATNNYKLSGSYRLRSLTEQILRKGDVFESIVLGQFYKVD
jgi:hypothetical protein